MPGKQEAKKQGEVLTLATAANPPFAPNRLSSCLPSFLCFSLTLLGKEAWGGGDNAGEGCLKGQEIKVVPHSKPQESDVS